MDKYRGITRLPLAEDRVNHLLGRLASNKSSGSYTTQEELTRAYAYICNKIAAGFDKRIYKLPKAIKGVPLSDEELNLYLVGIYSEILYLLSTVKNTAEMTEENFNFATAGIRKLQGDLKYCRQQLSSFSLYATQFDTTLHHGETFSTEVNIDRGSTLLSEEECFIDLAEGTISLPRVEEPDVFKIQDLQVGENSNGILGNNTEANVPVRGNIAAIYDGNVDTWTEYERITDSEDISGLKLELKLILDEVQPVNGIRICPVFLGARTPFAIRAIDVSSDGRSWVSLKDEVRVAEFLDEDPEGRYHLSPHSSRFAGEFNITFAPRFVKFIKILIRQSSAFPIFDAYNVRRLRYAIALKEIEILGHKYSSSGELISRPISFTRDISALAINSLVDPPLLPREVGNAEYFISYDDGSSWEQIAALHESRLDIPEVLSPPEGISSIRYKLHLLKDELAFAQSNESIPAVPFIERFGWAARRPFDLPLLHKPVEGTLSVCDPEAATRGRVYPKTIIGYGVASSLVEVVAGGSYQRHDNTQLKLPLPFKNIKDPTALHLYVNNVAWIKVNAITDLGDAWANKYVIQRSADDDRWEVVFGNGSASSPLGKIPGPADSVSIFMSEEYCVIEGLTAPYKMKLDYSSDGVKKNTSIRVYLGTGEAELETVPNGVTQFKLQGRNVLVGDSVRGLVYRFNISIRNQTGTYQESTNDGDVSPPVAGSFRQFKQFVNGDSELIDVGDWTVDSKNGILHLKTKTESTFEYTLNYTWQDIIELTPTDWDFAEGKLDEINIYQSGYKTREESIAFSSIASSGDSSGVITVLTEPITGIVPKSLRVQSGKLGGYRAFEIPFIDGRTEFQGRAKLQDETIPTAVSGANSLASWRLTHWQQIVASASPFFSDTSVFITEKTNLASCVTAGDYFFDGTGVESAGVGYIYIHMGGVGVALASGQTVAYQYADEFATERMKGAYSVDAVKGMIHFSLPLATSDMSKRITFKYTPYRVRYNISKQLEEGLDYEIDTANQKVRVLSGASGATENFLTVNYKYQPEELKTMDLAPYFSPLVRALDIRVA